MYETEIMDEKGFRHSSLVGHIHHDNIVLTGSNRTLLQILQKCRETISHYIKKRSCFSLLKQITISASESCSDCLCDQFTIKLPDTSSSSDGDLKRDIHTIANTIYPILINTVVKGDP